MANRTIAITVTLANRDAVRGMQAQTTASDQATQSLDELRRQTELTGLANQKLSHLQHGLTNSFIKGNLAARGISMAVRSVINSFQFGVQSAIDFDFAMKKIEVITGTSGEALVGLENHIRAVARTSVKTSTEVAQTALSMSKMGLSGKEVQESIKGVIGLSVALDEDLDRTGQTVVKVLNAFQKEASEATKVADQLALVTKSSAITLEAFGTSFSFAGGTAAVAGVSFEELTSTFQVLSNAGIRASTQGTQMRKVIAELSDSSSKASTAIGGQTIQTIGLTRALGLLADKNLGIDQLTKMFGRTASSVAAVLLEYQDSLDGLTEKTRDVTNITGEMGDALMDETLQGSIAKIKSAFEDLSISLSKLSNPAVLGVLNALASAIKGASDAVQDLNGTVKETDWEKALPDLGSTQHLGSLAAQLKAVQESITTGVEWPGADKTVDQTKDLVKGTKEFEAQIKTLMERFKELGTDFKLNQLLGTPTSVSALAAEYKSIADQLVRLGEADNAVKVLEALERLKKKEKPHKLNSASTDMIALRATPFYDPTSDELDFAAKAERDAADMAKFAKANEAAAESMVKFANALGQVSSLQDQANFHKWTLESAASFHVMQVGVDGLHGSLNLLSTFMAEGLLSKAQNPFEGITNAFGDFAKQMTAQLISLTLRLLVFKAVLAMVGGGGGGFGFGFNSLGGSGFMDAMLKGMGGQLNPLKNAKGTDQVVRQPTMFMAGEAGPERVNITPRSKVGSGGSGGGNLTVVIEGDVYGAEKFREAVQTANDKMGRSFV